MKRFSLRDEKVISAWKARRTGEDNPILYAHKSATRSSCGSYALLFLFEVLARLVLTRSKAYLEDELLQCAHI
jgi:hypothetical protein